MNKDDLSAVLDDIWRRWVRGKADRKSPFHTPIVGTNDGNMRIMVLRQVDVMASRLRFHTDVRSSKTAAIGGGAPVSLLGYDPGAKIQIRGWGTGRIEAETPEADAAWAVSSPASRRCYLAPTAPGSGSETPTSGLPAHVENRVPDISETEAGRANFSILFTEIHTLEWLYLAHDGHRRAQFTRKGTDWQGRWLIP